MHIKANSRCFPWNNTSRNKSEPSKVQNKMAREMLNLKKEQVQKNHKRWKLEGVMVVK